MSTKEIGLDIRQKRGTRDVNKRDWARYSTEEICARDDNKREMSST